MRTCLLLSLGVCLMLLSNCARQKGPQRLQVSGTVHINGIPVSQGQLSLLPMGTTSGPAVGGTIRDGKFQIDRDAGPVPGEHRVEILAFRPTGKEVHDKEVHGPSNETVQITEQILPEQFNRNSELTTVIEPGTARQLKFDLQLPTEKKTEKKNRK